MPKQTKEPNAIELLKEDHKKVKDLFDRFEEEDDKTEKKSIADQAIQELKVHAEIEEEIFYPAVREAITDEDNLMNEAQEEHHVAKVLIAELENMEECDETFEAKFTVLAENVRHHIKEEEGEMLPEAKTADLDLEALGTQMQARKQELLDQGVPASPEEELIGGASSGKNR